MYVEYNSNNSGGSWWLKDEHWFALEKAGWKVRWHKEMYVEALAMGDKFASMLKPDENGRWLGALATVAVRKGVSLREAAEEWESVTGLSALDAGCACCGQPHTFTEYTDDGKWVDSGPSASYKASW